MNRRNRIPVALRHATCLAAVGVCLAGLMARAYADVKITVEVTTDNGAPTRPYGATGSASPDATGQNDPASPPAPRKVTIYYKGKMARREVEGGATTLYNGAANKVYALFPDQKTYSVVATKDAVKVLAALNTGANTPSSLPAIAGSLPEGVHQDTQTALDKTGLTQSVAGKDTQKYTLEANVRLVRDQPSGGSGRQGGYGGGGGRGRRGGGGGYGGGYGGRGGDGGGGSGGQGSPQRGGMAMPTTEMEGEYWLADASLLPEGSKSPALPLLVDTVPASGILKSLNDKMTKLKMIPLSSKVMLRTSAYNPNGSSRALTVLTTQVTSIVTTPLDDALFTPPADYQKVDAEAAARQSRVTHDVDGH